MGKPKPNTLIISAADEAKKAEYSAILKRFPGNTASTQTVRLCNALKSTPVTTFDARKYLDVYDVPARVMELRRNGYQIDTLRVAQETDAGVLHRRIGLYVLQGRNHE